jgi:hypothetical protein
VPEEILYDRMRTIWTGTDKRGEIVWNAVFLDFARYWGFTPRLNIRGESYRLRERRKAGLIPLPEQHPAEPPAAAPNGRGKRNPSL